MNIVITGATGFVGSNLLEYLFNINHSPKDCNLRVNNWKALIDNDSNAIIHLAGKAHDIKKSLHTEDFIEANTILTIELFDHFLLSSCRDFIYFSSIKAVVDNSENIITETTLQDPQTPFGISKYQAEKYLLSQPIPHGKRIIILRPCMIHGPANKGNLNLLFKIVSKRIPWPLGKFENQRSFCSIDNVCFVIQQILERKEIPSGVYNLADDESISTNELIKIIADSSYQKVRILSIPKKIIYALARLGDIFHLPLNTERLNKLTENFVVSNTKIKAVLGIEKLPVSAKEGLTKTIKSFN